MKITALVVLKCGGGLEAGYEEAKLLANASDVSQVGFFYRGSAKELITFVARTIAQRTPAGQRQSVQQEEYIVHAYNRNGLCGVAFVDAQYPMRSAFSVVTKVLDEYERAFGTSWQIVQSDKTESWPYLNEALVKYQDPEEADKLLKIQKELDETKHILHMTIDSVLARGQTLDSLMAKSSDLSMASRVFYKEAKRTNQCCTIL